MANLNPIPNPNPNPNPNPDPNPCSDPNPDPAQVHLMRGEVEALVEDAVTLRFLPPDVDRAALLPPLKRVFARGKLAAAELESARRGGEGAGLGSNPNPHPNPISNPNPNPCP